MNLIFWRHAEAAPGYPDLARPLTEKGHKQAKSTGRWLDDMLPRESTILVSPAVRTKQTADALHRQYELCDQIAPDRTVTEMLAVTEWPNAERTVVIVGHNPAITQAAATLLNGNATNWTMQKGGIWWFTNTPNNGELLISLKAVISPKLARKLYRC
jgi:phosphohistidine phosphatase